MLDKNDLSWALAGTGSVLFIHQVACCPQLVCWAFNRTLAISNLRPVGQWLSKLTIPKFPPFLTLDPGSEGNVIRVESQRIPNEVEQEISTLPHLSFRLRQVF